MRSPCCAVHCTKTQRWVVQVRMFKDLIRQKEHMVLPDLAQDLAQVIPHAFKQAWSYC